MSNNKCLGFIETFGLAACVAAADAAVKSANVKLLGYEYAKGGGMCTVKVEGNVGACKAAIAAGKKAAEAVNGSLSGTKSTLLKARPADGMRDLLVDNRETVGGDIALAEGYRPKGDTKKPVLVKNWKPKTEPKAEVVTEEAPEPPVVEESEEEPTSEEPETEKVKEEAPVEEPKAEEPAEEPPVEEAPVEEAPVEEPKAEEPAPEAPAEETPVEKPETEEAAPEETETKKDSDKKAEPSKGKTSTGNRRSRSRRKKNTDNNDNK